MFVRRALSPLVLPVAACLVGCTGALDVESAQPRQGTIEESFREPARTRLERTHLLSLPIDARVEHIDLEPGDTVTKGQQLVNVDLVPFQLAVEEGRSAVQEFQAQMRVKEDDQLERTLRLEVEATIEASQEALRAASQQVAAQKKRAEHAVKELQRLQNLVDTAAVSQQELDKAQLLSDTAEIQYLEQEFNEKSFRALIAAIRLGPQLIEDWLSRKQLENAVVAFQLAQAQHRLALAEHRLQLAQGLRAPIDGIVLEKLEDGESALAAGTPLLKLGSLADLEVISEVLTQDALRLAPGAPVELEPGGGRPHLAGAVERIEPAAFTKLSSLGIEQQRVNVIVRITDPHDGIGVGWRLQARFTTGSKDGALIVPRFSVLQAPDRSYYVMRIAGHRLERRAIELGLQNDLELEVTSGLSAGDTFVRTPDATMTDGARVRVVNDQ